MRFPDVTELGRVAIEDREFVLLMVDIDWEPDDPDHDSDHAGGRCSCPCSQPLDVLLAAANSREDTP